MADGFTAQEEIAAPTFNFGVDKSSATRMFGLPWSDIESFTEEFLPSAFIAGETQGGSDTPFPGKDYLILKGISIKPASDMVSALDADGVAACDAGAVATLTYETVEYDTNGDDDDPNVPDVPFLTHKIRGSQQMLSHSSWGLKWAAIDTDGNDTLPNDMKPGYPIAMVDHHLIWERVTNPPWDTIYDRLGKINLVDFLGHQEGVVLFIAFDADRKITSGETGDHHWTLDYHFKARIIHDQHGNLATVTWNHFMQPNWVTTPWVKIEDESDNDIISSASFAELFELDIDTEI